MICLVVSENNVWIQVQFLRDTSCRPVVFALAHEFFGGEIFTPNVIRAIKKITVLGNAKLLSTYLPFSLSLLLLLQFCFHPLAFGQGVD